MPDSFFKGRSRDRLCTWIIISCFSGWKFKIFNENPGSIAGSSIMIATATKSKRLIIILSIAFSRRFLLIRRGIFFSVAFWIVPFRHV
jgi:hypothetical protein